MKKMKLEVSKNEKLILEKMRERLADVLIEDDGKLSRIKGGCGEQCMITCAWWCEDACQESCMMTSTDILGPLGNLCAHKPMGGVSVPQE
jgi:hypothetical protein